MEEKNNISSVQRFEVLDSFRGLAAICVVVFHMHFIDSITEWNFFRGSSLFVEFFFVLSGFVLAHGYLFKNNLKFSHFATSRTFRLFPLHIFMLIVFIIFEIFKLYAYKNGFVFNNLPFTETKALSEILPNFLLLQSWLPFSDSSSWNYPSWSISIEYYMYMIFFITIYSNIILKNIIYLLISITSLILIVYKLDYATEIFRGLSCFFIGVLTYQIFKISKKMINLNINKFYFSILELVIVLCVIVSVSSKYEYKAIVATLLFSFQIFIFGFEKGILSVFFKQKIFLYLGKLSYSIYMIHSGILFCLISFFMILQKIFKFNVTFMHEEIRYLSLGNAFYNNFVICLILLVTIFLSHFTYKYIEKKGQEIGEKIRNKYF